MESVYDMRYSADGKTLLIAGETAAYLWDVDADKEIACIVYSDATIFGGWRSVLISA
jgi:hypothetical protein